ncbi:tRNA (guanosine(46)-N7)-methyltransferase TrmB [Litorimonas sp. RW-G-Af-16]|uniref:tRNA (guanosine(46)-N7)-methyltransferase TrmB n=1 Tax=Litorimonas sp. RW-G-Af-16 TaxID=3241168 RepID=UPI00390CCC4C
MFNRDTQKFRTFGRAKGKALTAGQQALMDDVFPKFDVGPDIKAGRNPFAGLEGPLWLEIGFGAAEHLIWQAQHNPDVSLLGVEPFLNGIAKATKGINDHAMTNLRLHRGDARDVLSLIPDGALDRVFVLFPDPWHKTRHHKRRLLRTEFIQELHRVIKPGGELRFGSDILHYVDWAMTRFYRHGGFSWSPTQVSDWRMRGEDWPETRYLKKALREGRTGHFFTFQRV